MDDRDTVQLLRVVLTKLEKVYDATSKEVGINWYASGVIAIWVKNEPKFFFFDEADLIEWLELEAKDVGQ